MTLYGLTLSCGKKPLFEVRCECLLKSEMLYIDQRGNLSLLCVDILNGYSMVCMLQCFKVVRKG